MRRHALLLLVVLLAAGAGLGSLSTKHPTAPLDAALGGDTTRPDATRNAFGLPAANLDGDERRRFELGDSFFTQNWVTAPASTGARDGLGPTFNAQACASCHVQDGRGAPPDGPEDATTRGLLLRLSVSGRTPNGEPVPEPSYGSQLQDRAVLGVPVEGRMQVDYTDAPGSYADGTPFTLRVPTHALADLAFGPLAADTKVSARLAPQVMGMGLLEAVPEASIRAAADANDTDGDGISGRVNEVWDVRSERRQLGRFGWKANQPTVEQQVADAFRGDIGITSTLSHGEDCPLVQIGCRAAPNGGYPEVDDGRLAAVTFYSRTLAVPAMRDTEGDEVVAGARQFTAMGCGSCHTTTQRTGDHEVEAVANQTIHAFTDLLLHDMGPGLADNRPDFEALGNEWRTPPLWGLGLVDDVNGGRFLLHDGRARSFAEAILWHGGEGSAAAEAFRSASAEERAELLAYLEAL